MQLGRHKSRAVSDTQATDKCLEAFREARVCPGAFLHHFTLHTAYALQQKEGTKAPSL